MKKDKSRYDTSGLIDGQFEPGPGGRVLKNLLGIKRKREMDQVEAREQGGRVRSFFLILPYFRRTEMMRG